MVVCSDAPTAELSTSGVLSPAAKPSSNPCAPLSTARVCEVISAVHISDAKPTTTMCNSPQLVNDSDLEESTASPMQVAPDATPRGFASLQHCVDTILHDLDPFLSATKASPALYSASKSANRSREAEQKRFRLDADILRQLAHPMSLDQLTAAAATTSKLQRVLAEAVHRRHFLELYASLPDDGAERARLLSQAQEGSAGFLVAVPSEPDLQVADSVMQLGVRMWLGIPVDVDGRSSEESLTRCLCKAGQRAAAAAAQSA